MVEYLASFIEISFGFLLTIILYSPIGSFNLKACYTSRQIRKNIGRQFYNFFRRVRLYIILVGYWYLVPNVNRDSYFNPFQSNGLDAEDCLYEVVYPRFSIILCSIRKISKFKKKIFDDFEKKFSSIDRWNWTTQKIQTISNNFSFIWFLKFLKFFAYLHSILSSNCPSFLE